MVKFGKQLEEYELPEWRGHYIPYKSLKRGLHELTTGLSSPSSAPSTPRSLSALSLAPTPFLSLSRNGTCDSVNCQPDRAEIWRGWVTAEATRVGRFVDRGLQGLTAQLEELSGMADGLHASSSGDSKTNAEDQLFLELRLLDAIGRVAEGAKRLRGFAELNHAALYKTLKKHDKLLMSHEGLGRLFPHLVSDTRLGDSSRFDALDAELRRLSLLGSHTQGLNASPEVARLAAGLGRSRGAVLLGQADGSATRRETVLCFFLGTSAALLLSIGVLLALPEKNRRSFSVEYFLTPIPTFRLVFSVLLLLWCMGAVAGVCDMWDINHMFILGVDPRCRVSPEFFFTRAAALTTFWILIFGMYVVDYKWQVLPQIGSPKASNGRASAHFVVYPLLLFAITLMSMLWPSRVCRNRHKVSLFSSVMRTVLAPRYPVDFADNITGDVLTSIAKPLQDVPAIACYLAASHAVLDQSVPGFVENGDTCNTNTHHAFMKSIAGVPYFFRALQCLRRFNDTKETVHLWDLGKYASCLLVVAVSAYWWISLGAVCVVCAACVAYSVAWDVLLDWGLGWSELLGPASEAPQAPQAARTAQAGAAAAAPPGRAGCAGARRPRRHFSRRTYWICCVLNLVARCIWVLTLMPITIVTRDIILRELLVSFLSIAEILRRSMWVVLRIEHEQVANASGFRALLWVPSRLNAGSPWQHAQQPLLAS